jgi:hypothetical protein
MKNITKIGILGLMLTAAATQAQIDIYITGSTAFRSSAYRGIISLYGTGLQNQNPAGPITGAGNQSGANVITWSGTMTNVFGAGNNTIVTIHGSYNGSVGGIQTLVQNLTPTYFLYATYVKTNTISGPADLAFSDVYQGATAYQVPALRDLLVAVQNFGLVKSVSTPASVTNITGQQLLSLLANGFMPLSYFTGKTNDSGTNCYLPGRSLDSGTRLTIENDTFFVPNAEQPYAPDVNGNWSASVGYSSGSGVKGALNQANAGPAIGYLGLSDASGVNGGANIITYNGVLPFKGTFDGSSTTVTNDYTPVIMGQYSYWSYEHLFERTSVAIGSNVDKFRTALGAAVDNDILTVLPKYNLRLSEMKVHRTSDGGPITP